MCCNLFRAWTSPLLLYYTGPKLALPLPSQGVFNAVLGIFHELVLLLDGAGDHTLAGLLELTCSEGNNNLLVTICTHTVLKAY